VTYGTVVNTIAVGSMLLHFEDCVSALISYELETSVVSGQIPLSRIDQSSVDLCEMMMGQNVQ